MSNLIRVTFHYVGNGDCLTIEWNDRSDTPRLGVIDCRRTASSNPVVDRINELRLEEVEFIILSHPHEDHFSGLVEVFNYCEEKDIQIKRFLHTSRNVRDYLRSAVMSVNNKNTLIGLFTRVKNLYQDGLLKQRGTIADNTAPIGLTPDVQLSFCAPSQEEYDAFIGSLYHPDLDIKTQPNPNLLSSIILVEFQNFYILLTSDAEEDAQYRVGAKTMRKESREMILGQVPHHGAESNYYHEFWKRRLHSPGTPTAISFGPNGYGHPDPDTIDQLKALNYSVHTTGSFAQVSHIEDHEIMRDLNLVSTVAGQSSDHGSELVFEADGQSGQVKLVS